MEHNSYEYWQIRSFALFDQKNPDVWKLFKRYAFEAIGQRRNRLSANLIINRIRWDESLGFIDNLTGNRKEQIKLSNGFSPAYARKFEYFYPQYKGLFTYRKCISIYDLINWETLNNEK